MFSASAEWTKGRSGVIEQKALYQKYSISAPHRNFRGNRTNGLRKPCYSHRWQRALSPPSTQLRKYSGFAFNSLSVAVEGAVARAEGKLQFKTIHIKPTVEIERESKFERAVKLLERTKQACLISRSLSAEIVLMSEIKTAAAVA